MKHQPSRNHPVPVVVYGTLRTGGTLKSYYFPGLQGEPTTIVDHQLLFSPSIPYPFLTPRAGEQAMGEVYWVADPQVLARVTAMEEQAGYVRDWVTVRSDLHDVEYQALAFIWQDDTAYGANLQSVPDGDWLALAGREGVAL